MNLTASLYRPKVARSEPYPNDKQAVWFEVRLPRAKSVWLLGIVGDWHPSFVSLNNQGNGLWTKRIELTLGDFSYRLVVDGSWIDAAARVKTDDASRGTITRDFSIPRRSSAATDRADQGTPESRQAPTIHFLAPGHIRAPVGPAVCAIH